MDTPATLLDLPRSAHIAARAYCRREAFAALATPLMVLVLTPLLLCCALYLSSDRTGIVAVHRRALRPVFALASVALILAVCQAIFLGLLAFSFDPVGSYLVGFGWFLISVVVFLIGTDPFSRHSTLTMTIPGGEGSAYYVSFLAQLPGTSMSAILLARSIIDRLPPGSVIHIETTIERARKYERAGFVPKANR